ncbi:hypothetical protein AB1Y20_017236 [Prymnesium parvum]|uniref:Uncharacterized protein n=1 Tax=Prymnesium parvum TaxID=97485 RepID=A0AB34IB32_PRYPA|mmetsp:Transcript_38183/g.87361  ORF Transcript_38183/g.87361 Transcript_38183/m.87361 type:complete len:337 (+) Transcript_38183:242-1252(+)
MGDEFDVDEWRPDQSTFAQHAVAGSVAGLAEHSLMFPVDTIKTLRQVRTQHLAAGGLAVADGGLAAQLHHLIRAGGLPRMWRGVQTMFAGCVPAHSAYFLIYEGCKPTITRHCLSLASERRADVAVRAASAGVSLSLATMVHDMIMTPMDVCKQRLQLGFHANSVIECACDILRREGARAFYLSYPTTLFMNVPYALLMGATNDALRTYLNPHGTHSVGTYLAAGAGAGVIAAALTNPLDVVKTRLQTQAVCEAPPAAAPCATTAARASSAAVCPHAPICYTGLWQALGSIWREEGYRGFTRGVHARMLIHAPSVAICWTTYESMKHTLQHFGLFE